MIAYMRTLGAKEWGNPLFHLCYDFFPGGIMAKQDVGARIEGLLDEYLADKELEIYNIEYKKEGKDWKLRIYLDKPIGCDSEYVDINECEDVTHFLSDR